MRFGEAAAGNPKPSRIASKVSRRIRFMCQTP
jgi:hypothetical protein